MGSAARDHFVPGTADAQRDEFASHLRIKTFKLPCTCAAWLGCLIFQFVRRPQQAFICVLSMKLVDTTVRLCDVDSTLPTFSASGAIPNHSLMLNLEQEEAALL